MIQRKSKLEDESGGLPSWVISFADMITLLLAFFVLLQAFAKEQTPELFYEGQGSFRQAIRSMGIPAWLYGKPKKVKREWFINRHPAEPDPSNELDSRIIDAEQDQLQRIFQKLKENMDSKSDNMHTKPLRVEVTPIRFEAGSDKLNAAAKKYLDEQAVDLPNNLPAESSTVYVIGLAPEQTTDRDTWVLSTRRAMVAEQYLRGKLKLSKTQTNWQLYGWGGGKTFGRFPKGTYVGLVVMGANHGG